MPLMMPQHSYTGTSELNLEYEMMRECLEVRPAMMIVDKMKVLRIIPNALYHVLGFCEKLIGQLLTTLDKVMIKYLAQVTLDKRV